MHISKEAVGFLSIGCKRQGYMIGGGLKEIQGKILALNLSAWWDSMCTFI